MLTTRPDTHVLPRISTPAQPLVLLGLYFISTGACGAEQQFRQHSPPIRAHVCSPAAAYAKPHLSCSPHIPRFSCRSPPIQLVFLGGLTTAGISDKGFFKAAPSIHCVLDFTHTSRNEAGGTFLGLGDPRGRGRSFRVVVANETPSFKCQPSQGIPRDSHWFPAPLSFKVPALKVGVFIH